ncbi:hypothetical protein SD427_11600 [Chryseobacterium sp. JJR-5R]|uniref:hypothetical protein n=1 Tax=Chryseobacterium sp. JJR-5R TaxID=3093923 RepID=UPI002A74D89B|nr:hypothetical protein [Chryseobacterium sp. JJR-5R]WPO81408.1 hypothetical protein SD427_11600 [Chryseobacterium sp. JJR-5R]
MKNYVDNLMNTDPEQKAFNSNIDFEYILIPTVKETKQFFGPITSEERTWRDKMYFDALLKSPRSKLGIGEHDRAEAYIFGNGIFPDVDSDAHKNHFPVSVKVMRIEELFIPPGETVDLTAHPGEFPWDTGDSEIYLHLTVKRLILSRQSRLVVNGNVFILNCEEAVAHDLNGGYAIIELGTSDFIQQLSFPRLRPVDEALKPEINGVNGADGFCLNVESTPLGLRVIDGGESHHGSDGTDGRNGLKGGNGRNGAMLFLSDLRFGRFSGFKANSIHLKACAGTGFPGSDGSQGGNGGNGGNGADGLSTPFGIAKGFAGGSGGNGGNGGNGGRGGSGGMSCDIFLSLPFQSAYFFQAVTSCSSGGNGGKGGAGGKGGYAGLHGDLYENEGSAEVQNGKNGHQGFAGADGRTREAPKIHIYERK